MREMVSTIWTAVRRRIGEVSGAHRIAVGALGLAVVVVPVGLFWALSPEGYRVLASNLRMRTDFKAVTAELDKAGIAWRPAQGGHSVLVSRADYSEAQRAVNPEKLNGRRRDTDWRELMEKQGSLDLYPEVQRQRRLRALEGEIAKTISMCGPVEFARVHITQPDRTPWLRESPRVTASVFVELTSGTRLTGSQVASIRRMVSHAVEGLTSENVTLCDTDGTDYTSSTEGARRTLQLSDASVTREVEMTRMAETVLLAKVKGRLARLFRPDDVAASVTVEMSVEGAPVTTADRVVTGDRVVGVPPLGGFTTASLSMDGHMVGAGLVASTSRMVGRVRRVFVSVLLDAKALSGGTLSTRMRDTLDADVRAALGLCSKRGDSLSIQVAEFRKDPDALTVADRGPRTTRDRPPLAHAAGALTQVAGTLMPMAEAFNMIWIGQVLLLTGMLWVLVRRLGHSPDLVRASAGGNNGGHFPIRLQQFMDDGEDRDAAGLEQLLNRRDRDFPIALASAPEETLIVALRSATPCLRNRILGLLSSERSRRIESAVGRHGPVSLGDAESARRRLSKILSGAPAREGRRR